MDSATPTPAMPGSLIADRYRLVRPLGAGSSATVWEAADTALNRTVAVKLLHSSALADPTERERLRREALALARLAHPRVTIVFDYLEQPQPDGGVQPVLVTELLHGKTLSERLGIGPLPAADAVAVCGQLADALRAAHEAGIVHRDVKPGNVVLTAGGAKLLDFGIALASADSNLTGNMAIGTPACMAPEQLTGRGAVPASDIYALGCVLYWCLTGRPPYDSANVAQVAEGHVYAPPPPLNVPGVPQGVVELYQRCMAKDPTQRPSAAEVFTFLSRPMTDLPPAPQRTMVMSPFEVPTQPSWPQGHGHGHGHGEPAAAAGSGRAGSRFGLVVGALLIAAIAAAITALILNSAHSGNASAGAPPTTTPAAGSSTPAASASTDSPSASAASADPATDPIGFLEAMRSQIDGFIAQGADTLDPNAGRDLQNSIGDLENAITAARDNGDNKQQRQIRQKINDLMQRISDDQDNGLISQDAADQLTGELQDLADALPNNAGNN